MSKATLRKELRTRRRRMNPEDHSRLSKLAAAGITRLAAFKAGARVAIYLPFDCETHTGALVVAARRRGIQLYVPVVSDRRHRRLTFYPFAGPTKPGVFGISVPRGRGAPLQPRWFDLIVVPLVGIDARGYRLGMGGGFYDRALAYRRERRLWMGPRLVGFAFDCQRVATVDADPWDVRLDCLATESGVGYFAKGIQ